jgi:hypothetical protein
MKNNLDIEIKCIANKKGGFILSINEKRIKHCVINPESKNKNVDINLKNIKQLIDFVYKNAVEITTTTNDKKTIKGT